MPQVRGWVLCPLDFIYIEEWKGDCFVWLDADASLKDLKIGQINVRGEQCCYF